MAPPRFVIREIFLYGFRLAAGVIFLGAIDRLLSGFFRISDIQFPGSVAGMLLLFGLLLAADYRLPVVSRAIVRFLSTAVTFLTRWMALFFVPALVILPEADLPLGSNIWKLLVLVFAGFFFTLGTTAWLAGQNRVSSCQERAEVNHAVQPISYGSYFIAWLVPGIVTGVILLVHPNTFVLWLFLLSVTVVSYVIGLFLQGAIREHIQGRLPVPVERTFYSLFHPVITGTCGTLVVLWMTGFPFPVYVDPVNRINSAGGVLLELLQPAVVALGFILYKERILIGQNVTRILSTTLAAALLSLFISAAGAGWMHLHRTYALAVIPRSVTTPIAIPIAQMLGALPGLTAAIVVFTGVIGAVLGPSLLSLFRVNDPAVRGLAIGASSHGIGTAALLGSEPEAAAFSSVGFALMGAFTTIATGIPFVRQFLINLVGIPF